MMISCLSKKEQRLHVKKDLDEYFDQYGNDIVSLIDKIDENVDSSGSYVLEYRLKGNQVFAYHLDSNYCGAGYFELPFIVSPGELSLLSSSTISDIIKIKGRKYFHIEFAVFTPISSTLKMVISKKGIKIDEKAIYAKKKIGAIEDPNSPRWMYKKTDRFAFLETNE